MILALSGGVGGAKLGRGLADVVEGSELTIVVNTGDDFDFLGLRICPDLDSVAYGIAGLNDEDRGWGRRDESWHCEQALVEFGVDPWFHLGDKDLAIHLLRRSLLASGATAGEAMAQVARSLGIGCAIVPMTECRVETRVITNVGELSFQDYFVRRRCEPMVSGFRFSGAETASPSPTWFPAVAENRIRGVILCPSNPFVSIDPILGLPGVRAAFKQEGSTVVAVSPLVGGNSVKGPLAKMLRELGLPATPVTIAKHYADFLDGFVLDVRDEHFEPELRAMGLRVEVCDTLMSDRHASRRLARSCLDLLIECGSERAA